MFVRRGRPRLVSGYLVGACDYKGGRSQNLFWRNRNKHSPITKSSYEQLCPEAPLLTETNTALLRKAATNSYVPKLYYETEIKNNAISLVLISAFIIFVQMYSKNKMEIEKLYTLFLESKGVTTDTRTCADGLIFFALKGERFNGNSYEQY